MQTVTCTPGQSFVVEGPDGRTRVTVVAVEDGGVRLGVEEDGLHYREVFLTTDEPAADAAGLLATIG